jgi:hypothetical protein
VGGNATERTRRQRREITARRSGSDRQGAAWDVAVPGGCSDAGGGEGRHAVQRGSTRRLTTHGRLGSRVSHEAGEGEAAERVGKEPKN